MIQEKMTACKQLAHVEAAARMFAHGQLPLESLIEEVNLYTVCLRDESDDYIAYLESWMKARECDGRLDMFDDFCSPSSEHTEMS